jgi:hypothetical protein
MSGVKTAVSAILLMLAATLWAQEIPPGTALPVKLISDLDGRRMDTGQPIVGRIAQNVPLPARGIIPAGSPVEGRVVKSGKDADGESVFVFKIDEVQVNGRKLRVSTKLRVIASFMEVQDAQTPSNGVGAGSESEETWTTTQVGGDDVYRGGGHVYHDTKVVGDPVAGGVLAELIATPHTGCDDSSNGRRMALWVFSSGACGAYGLGRISAWNSDPAGEIVLSDPKKVHVPKGSGMLLIVIAPPTSAAAKPAFQK